MHYQLLQNSLTSLINFIAISGGVIASTSFVYKHWKQYRDPQTAAKLASQQEILQPNLIDLQETQSQSKNSYLDIEPQFFETEKDEQQYDEIAQLQQQLSLTREQLQQTQLKLEKTQQDEFQLQTCLDAVKIQLQQAQQQEQKYQSELDQLKQQLSLVEEQLQQTQQKLENTEKGLQGFVNQLFNLDRSSKVKFKDFFLNKELLQAAQSANK